MKKFYNKSGFYVVLLIFVLWAGASTYWYTCSLKDLCSLKQAVVRNNDKIEKNKESTDENIPIHGTTALKKQKITKQKITCTPYLKKSIKLGGVNDINEVAKLEKFLNDFEKENLTIDGYYQKVDYNAVKRFQEKYSEDLGLGWVIKDIDGIVGPETMEKINLIYCIEKGKEYLKNNSN